MRGPHIFPISVSSNAWRTKIALKRTDPGGCRGQSLTTEGRPECSKLTFGSASCSSAVCAEPRGKDTPFRRRAMLVLWQAEPRSGKDEARNIRRINMDGPTEWGCGVAIRRKKSYGTYPRSRTPSRSGMGRSRDTWICAGSSVSSRKRVSDTRSSLLLRFNQFCERLDLELPGWVLGNPDV